MTDRQRDIHLTPEQKRLVDCQEGAFLVLAPPGSGKTEVLVQRILRLLEEDQSATSRLLALTFTRKAAREMRRRVETVLDDSTRRATITTYHGFAHDLLRQHGKVIGFSGRTTIYSTTEDRIEALRQGLADEGIGLDGLTPADIGNMLERISRAKRDLLPPEAVSGYLSVVDAPLSVVYEAYERAMEANDATDFDGLLGKAYRLLADHPGVSKYYRQLYRWILIDEGQDTCLAEYELLRVLCGASYRNVFVVADRDQSIFRFRGASSEYLDRFVREFDAETFSLDANFRCAEEVVRVSRAFLQDRPVPIQSHADAQGWVGAYSFADERREAAWVADWVEHLIVGGLDSKWLAPGESPAVEPDDLAVLARARRLLDPTCRELTAREIPFVLVTGETSLFDSELLGRLLYGLRVRANPFDLALRRSLAGQLNVDVSPGPGGETGLREFLRDLSNELSLGPLREPLVVLAGGDADVSSVADWLQRWEPVDGDTSEELAELLASDLDLLRERLRIFTNTVAKGDRTWQGLVRAIIEHPAPDKPGVRVMTIHGAKGLEFRAVAVVGLNEGSLPDFRSVEDQADLAAERRLAYVAASRASRALVLTRARSVETRYGTRSKEPSPFLQEAGVVMADR